MLLDRARYHSWEGEYSSPWRSSLSITRVAFLQVIRRKAYWFLLGLALLNFLAIHKLQIHRI